MEHYVKCLSYQKFFFLSVDICEWKVIQILKSRLKVIKLSKVKIFILSVQYVFELVSGISFIY